MLKRLLRTVTPSETSERQPGRTAHDSESDVEFLTPAEQVLALLETHNGRIRQQDIAAKTGYADSTVSQLLGEMEANGQINRYWKEGGKIVALPDVTQTPEMNR